ncbi:MAG: class I SAM-dependent rRNA methyltransferase [Bacteroidota bacterium]
MKTPSLDKHIVLRRNEEHRITEGHPWVFSNEIVETRGTPVIGDVVEVLSSRRESLGTGLYNPHSLIAVRMLSSNVVTVDDVFFTQRITDALRLRQTLYPDSTAYRLVHGESDFLPGLVIDRFNDIFAVQALSYGMDSRLPIVCDVLEALFHPIAIIERGESPLRTLETLPLQNRILRGEVYTTEIVEHGLRYTVDVLKGQKTGFFLDQRENRFAIRRFSKGARVLDCFCNYGGFGLNAAAAGATEVVGIDISEEAIQKASHNASLNELRTIRFEQADVFQKLEELQNHGATFDVVVLDPPSFTKNRKNVQAARKGYRELHMKALCVTRPGGILITASCSHHIEPGVFLDILAESAQRVDRHIQVLDWRGAAPDHPILPRVPETHYLKFAILRAI